MVFEALLSQDGFDVFRGRRLVSPPLLWSEVRSSLHVSVHRGKLKYSRAIDALARLEGGEVEPGGHPQLGPEAWRIADELGWAKTDDAEYLALAHLLGAPLMTFDLRLRRAAGRIGITLTTIA